MKGRSHRGRYDESCRKLTAPFPFMRRSPVGMPLFVSRVVPAAVSVRKLIEFLITQVPRTKGVPEDDRKAIRSPLQTARTRRISFEWVNRSS